VEVSALSEIDAAIDRLDDALRSSGLPGLGAPADLRALDEVAEAVAPYELPAELGRFWERVDAEHVEVYTFPRLGGPASALALRGGLREYGAPPILLPIDYASHCYGAIELGSEWSEGGTILEWDLDAFPLVSHSVADRIALLAELVSEGLFERGDGYVALDHRAEQEKRLARLVSGGPHPMYGDRRAIPRELEAWPTHWLATSGIDLRDREPLGATHTIAELVAAAGAGVVTGRIHGEVIRLVGTAQETLVVVDDGTAVIDVSCPAGTSTWGPIHRRRFEFAVTIAGPVEAPLDLDTFHAAISQQALTGNLEAAQAAAESMARELEAHRPAAVASDIRPLD
jgi:hypothetical protein